MNDISNISDGKLYRSTDLVKIACQDCKGCSSCCEGMGDSIWMDPYDIYQLTTNLHQTFEELLQGPLELHVEDGLIMPNIRMQGEKECCIFLNKEGRCDIHAFRPGYCRLFPLWRNYEEGKLSYFVLKEACPAPVKTKVKIQKWLSIPNMKDYERFLIEWHALIKQLRTILGQSEMDDAVGKAINMKFLQIFFINAYQSEDFYAQIKVRLDEMKHFLQMLGAN